MEIIRGHCRTNLDGFDCTLVKQFAAIPRKDELVEVSYRGNVAYLKVCGITHTVSNNQPYIIVELTGHPRN